MKASILLLLILGVAAAAVPERVLHRSRRDLDTDLQDFVRVLSTRVLIIVKRYIDHDEEIQTGVRYFDPYYLHILVPRLRRIPEAVQLISYLVNAEVDVLAFLGFVNLLVEAAESTEYNSTDDGSSNTGGISGFIEEVESALPMNTLRNLYNLKLTTSEDFRKLAAAINSEEFTSHITAMGESEGYGEMVEEIGADLLLLFNIYKPMLGLQE